MEFILALLIAALSGVIGFALGMNYLYTTTHAKLKEPVKEFSDFMTELSGKPASARDVIFALNYCLERVLLLHGIVFKTNFSEAPPIKEEK